MKNFSEKLFSKKNLMMVGFALSPELLREYELNLEEVKNSTEAKAA